ncbi:lipopolysaccharide biosynthesis protein [Qipengyuania sp. RANM35]|uniref:lipopolysaccharide biosynthesis protein n=1 Tax=Qipengyuania sp. RANM35 TaxID=3068635 RepID=UPI0034DB18D4
MSLRLGVIRGALSLGSARIVASVLNALGILVLARLLTPEDFGIVAIATAVVTVAASLTEASLQPALVQNRNPDRVLVDTVWTMSAIRAVLVYGGVALAAWPLALAYGDERLFAVLLVAGLSGAFTDFFNPMLTLATRDMRFGPLVIFQVAQKACGLLLAIVLAFAWGNFWAIVVGNAIGIVLAALASYFLIPYFPALTLRRAREVWDFSGWMFLNQLCETVNWRFDQLAIGLYATKAQLGFYAMADNLAVIPSRELSLPLRNALFPGFSSLGEDRERLRKAYMEAQTGVAMLTAPAAIGLSLLAVPAVAVLLGEKWLVTAPIVQLLCLTYAFDTFITAVRPLGMAMGETKYLFLRQLAALFARIPLILLGFIAGGLVGAAAGRAASSLVNALISMMVVRKLLGVPLGKQLRVHMPTIASLGVMAIAVLGAWSITGLEGSLIQLLVLAPLGALAYAVSHWAIWLQSGRGEGAFLEMVRLAARMPGCGGLQRLAGA